MSTTALKLIALILMTVDHVGQFIPNMPIALHWIGRLSAPVFLYCTVQGISHTRNRKNYLLRLYAAGIIMGVLPIILLVIGLSIPNFSPQSFSNNIFRTLFCLSVLCCLIDSFQRKVKNRKKYLLIYIFWQAGAYLVLLLISKINSASPTTPLTIVSEFLPNLLGSIYYLEGGWIFLILGILLFCTKDNKRAFAVGYLSFCVVYFLLTATQLVAHVLIKIQYLAYLLKAQWLADFQTWLYEIIWMHSGLTPNYSPSLNLFFTDYQWMMVGALPLLLAYNGQRGKGYQYFFYLYYPAHIVLLYFVGGFWRGV